MACLQSPRTRERGSTSPASLNHISQEHDCFGPADASPTDTNTQTEQLRPPQSKVAMPFQIDSDDDSGSDLDVRPVGRAARRMLGGDQATEASTGLDAHSPSQAIGQLGTNNSDDELYTSTPKRTVSSFRAPPSMPPSAARSTLFVSPARTLQNGSDDDLPTRPTGRMSKLAALVAEKRAERLARAASEHASTELEQEPQDAGDVEIERIMSDAAKPTRRASRKALLEMARETQRIARQQALAHQMKTRKKFTTSDLFAKFNYRPAGVTASPRRAEGDTSASSAPNSDAIDAVPREPFSTPPSSPPTPLDRQRALVEKGALSKLVPVREDSLASIVENDDEDLPPLATVIGTARAAKQSTNEKTLEDKPAAQVDPKRGLKLARLGKRAMAPVSDESSDDDLEIVNELPKHLSLFDKAKGLMKQQNTDTSAIHRLKHLAHIGADDSRNARRKNGPARPSVNPQVLEAQLRLRAREQARAEQLERIAELKAKGIEVQTAEEREREQEAFENLLEKARQDAVDLRKAEKAVAKAENGGIVPSEDESEDEDYMDMSGSDEDVAVEGTGNEFVDELADDSDEGEEAEDEESQDEEMADDEVSMDPEPTGDATHVEQQQVNEHVARKPKKKRVILDDEDEDDEVAEATLPPSPSAQTPQQQEDDPFAAFNFGNAKPASSLMSPTQMFNATMQTPTQVTQQDSIDELNFFVPPSSSTRPPPTMDFSQGDSQVSVVPSSQLPPSQQVNLAWDTQAPETPVPGKARAGSELTIETPRWQPTQDDGLPATWQATIDSHGGDGPESDVEHETQATAPLRVSESPVVASKRNRLIRGKRRLIDSDDEAEEQSVPAVKDAFREMARKRNETLTAAERAEAEREAKQMMDEQAEESEDEYAGLGGDDFVAPETAEDREMIDSSHVEVNEGELAAHFAERQRVSDEAEANKLYKDLMTGGLRRKQANMFDLDEDEDDMAVRRRQMKQREEARKRKLLLQDDNVAGLAQGKQTKGKDAFLKALADDDEQDDEILDLSDGGDDEGIYSTQTDSQVSVPQGVASQPLVEVSGNKRRLEEETAQRPPAKQRRTQATAFRAPTSLTDVKESVSFLLEEPNVVDSGSNTLDMSSDSETEDATNPELAEDDNDDEEVQAELRRQNDGGFAPDRIAMPPPRMPASQRRTNTRPAVVDRLTLKRASSTSDNVPGRTAWAATGTGGFKTPSLLRRATTNNGANGANERGVSTSNGISRENSSSGVKMGGTKKSSLAYQARDAERQAIVQASAKRRAENTARIAQLRKSASSGGFGKGMTGTFE